MVFWLWVFGRFLEKQIQYDHDCLECNILSKRIMSPRITQSCYFFNMLQIYGMEARRYSLSKKPLYCKLHLIPSQTEIFAPFKSWGDLLLAIFNWFKFHRWSDIDDIIASWLSAVFSMMFWSRLWFVFFIGNITEIKGLVQACWYVLCLWKW